MAKLDLTERIEIAKIQGKKAEKIRKSLGASVKEGMASNVMQSCGVNFIIPFAVALRASNFQISIIASLPQLIGSLVQLLSTALLEKFKNRHKIISQFVLFQALTWLPMLLVPFFFLGENAVWLLIIFYTLFQAIGALIHPIWQGLMGDLVPVDERGKYFGVRNAAAGTITLVTTLFAGFYLNLYPENLVFYGFAALFFISFLFRVIARHFMDKIANPPLLLSPERKFSFRHFVSKISSTNFGNFVLFVSFLRIGEMIASPFFAVHMLKNLHFDYLTFTIIAIAPMISGLLVMSQWGRLSDKFGNRKILKVCSAAICLVPVYWVFFQSPLLLFIFEFFISGIFWAGFNLAAGNFLFDSTTSEKRTRLSSYFNIFNGTGIFIGAIIGGVLASIIPEGNFLIFGFGIYFVFLMAFIARAITVAFFANRIKEVRPVEKITDRQLFFNIITENPVRGFSIQAITNFAATAKKPIKSLGKDLQAIEKGIEDLDKEVEKAVRKTIETADKIVKRKKK